MWTNCMLLVLQSMPKEYNSHALQLSQQLVVMVLLSASDSLQSGLIAMSEEEPRDPEDPPFTPKQLVWIDKIITACQASGGSSSGSQEGYPPASEALPLVPLASQPGERGVVGVSACQEVVAKPDSSACRCQGPAASLAHTAASYFSYLSVLAWMPCWCLSRLTAFTKVVVNWQPPPLPSPPFLFVLYRASELRALCIASVYRGTE